VLRDLPVISGDAIETEGAPRLHRRTNQRWGYGYRIFETRADLPVQARGVLILANDTSARHDTAHPFPSPS
jgi:hypothetical protein